MSMLTPSREHRPSHGGYPSDIGSYTVRYEQPVQRPRTGLCHLRCATNPACGMGDCAEGRPEWTASRGVKHEDEAGFSIRWDKGMGCYRVSAPALGCDGAPIHVVHRNEYVRVAAERDHWEAAANAAHDEVQRLTEEGDGFWQEQARCHGDHLSAWAARVAAIEAERDAARADVDTLLEAIETVTSYRFGEANVNVPGAAINALHAATNTIREGRA